MIVVVLAAISFVPNAPDTGERAPDNTVWEPVLAHVNGRDLPSEGLTNARAAGPLHLERDGFLPGVLHCCRPGSLRHHVGDQGTVLVSPTSVGNSALLKQKERMKLTLMSQLW